MLGHLSDRSCISRHDRHGAAHGLQNCLRHTFIGIGWQSEAVKPMQIGNDVILVAAHVDQLLQTERFDLRL